jgi:hypothetical protein
MYPEVRVDTHDDLDGLFVWLKRPNPDAMLRSFLW